TPLFPKTLPNQRALPQRKGPREPGPYRGRGTFERLGPETLTKSFDLDPLEGIAVGTTGPPGQRQFFLRAAAAGESVVLNCEKFHVQGLITRILQVLAEQGVDPTGPGEVEQPAEPGQVEWTIGELGLGYHENRRMFVIGAREAS